MNTGELLMEGCRPCGFTPRDGKVGKTDEDVFQLSIMAKRGVVLMDFSPPIAWIERTPQEARELAYALLRCADEAAN